LIDLKNPGKSLKNASSRPPTNALISWPPGALIIKTVFVGKDVEMFPPGNPVSVRCAVSWSSTQARMSPGFTMLAKWSFTAATYLSRPPRSISCGQPLLRGRAWTSIR